MHRKSGNETGEGSETKRALDRAHTKVHRCQTEEGEKITPTSCSQCEKKSSSLLTCGPFGDFKAPALCLESETSEDEEEKLRKVNLEGQMSGPFLTSRIYFCYMNRTQEDIRRK